MYVHEFWVFFVFLGDLIGWGLGGGGRRSYMGKHRRRGCGDDGDQSPNNNGGRKKCPRKRNRKRASSLCHCFAVSSIFRGIGRCMFVTCFPVIQCFGLDECRHHHHHHPHKHFSEFS